MHSARVSFAFLLPPVSLTLRRHPLRLPSGHLLPALHDDIAVEGIDLHQEGDQPFQALIAKQIQVQPPSGIPATKLAPLRGRKVLIFSDSRQTAARLAPNIQTYSTQDALRPMIVAGYARITHLPLAAQLCSLADLYLGVLVAAKELGVRLRPELKLGETFHDELTVEAAVSSGAIGREADLLGLLMQLRNSKPPESLLRSIAKSIGDRYYGLESLAIASLRERAGHTAAIEALTCSTAISVQASFDSSCVTRHRSCRVIA